MKTDTTPHDHRPAAGRVRRPQVKTLGLAFKR